MIVVHHLNNSRSQRILWLLEELGLPYEIKKYQRDPKTMLAPPVEFPKPLDLSEPALPIDDSDGGCDTPQKPWYRAWTRENAKLDIGEFDGISNWLHFAPEGDERSFLDSPCEPFFTDPTAGEQLRCQAIDAVVKKVLGISVGGR